MKQSTKIVILMNQASNLLVFVGEICDLREHPWHNERRSEWLRESGGRMTKEEQLCKTKLKNIFSRIHYDAFEAQAITTDAALSEKMQNQQLGNTRTEELTHILQVFTPRFQKLWNKRKPRLQHLQTLLRKKIPTFANVLKDMAILSGIANNGQRSFTLPSIHLLMSSERKRDMLGWFSSMNHDIHLVLESSQKPDAKQAIFLQLILLHELFHAMVRANSGIRNIINRSAEQSKKILRPYSLDMSPELFLEEMLISSFVPEGYLAHAYFHSPISKMPRLLSRDRNITKARLYCAYHMREYAKTYLSEKRRIDNAFVQKLINVIENGQLKKSAAR